MGRPFESGNGGEEIAIPFCSKNNYVIGKYDENVKYNNERFFHFSSKTPTPMKFSSITFCLPLQSE